MANKAPIKSGGPNVKAAQCTSSRCTPVRGAGAPQIAFNTPSMRTSARNAVSAKMAKLSTLSSVARDENSANRCTSAVLALGTKCSNRKPSMAGPTAANSGNADNTKYVTVINGTSASSVVKVREAAPFRQSWRMNWRPTSAANQRAWENARPAMPSAAPTGWLS